MVGIFRKKKTKKEIFISKILVYGMKGDKATKNIFI